MGFHVSNFSAPHFCFLVVELPVVYLKTKNVVFVVKNNNVLFCSNIWRENHVMDRTLVSLNAPELLAVLWPIM